MKKILVPYDFSKYSAKALQYAVGIARQLNATIELIHVIDLPVIDGTLFVPVFAYEDSLKDELNQKIKKEFDKVTNEYAGGSVRILSKQLFGPVSRTILEYAKSHQFEIIIIGSHGASEFSEFLMGSNVLKIVRVSNIPVLVTKDQAHEEIRSIVFPHSLGIEGQKELVEKVMALQQTFDAHLHLVCINSPASFTSDEEFKARLDEFLRHFKFSNFTARIYGHPEYAEGIIRYAKSVNADLIAMATQGRTGVSHLMNDSVAESVVHQSHIPVWTYSLKNLHVPEN
jgi:nucleotide-binding universal stress UspA family protein